MDPSLIEAGLALTWALDDRFKVPRKHTLSQRDVPGMTRALIPLLKGAGVRAIQSNYRNYIGKLYRNGCTAASRSFRN